MHTRAQSPPGVHTTTSLRTGGGQRNARACTFGIWTPSSSADYYWVLSSRNAVGSMIGATQTTAAVLGVLGECLLGQGLTFSLQTPTVKSVVEDGKRLRVNRRCCGSEIRSA